MPPRLSFGVCAWIYGDDPLPSTFNRIAAAGYDGVEVPGEPDRWPPAAVRQALADSGLAPLALQLLAQAHPTAFCQDPICRLTCTFAGGDRSGTC